MAVNWDLGVVQQDPGNTFLNAFERGRQMRQQSDARNAFANYARNPSDPAGLDALAAFDPQFVIERKQAMAQQQRAEQERQLVGAALNGDPQARRNLAYVNSEMYLKLRDEDKKKVDAVMGTIAQQAFHILQLPREQQEPALQQALRGLQAQGVDTSGFKLSGNPEVDLRSALAMTGHLDEWEKFAEPKYAPVGERGLAGFQFGQPIMQGGQPQDFGGQGQPVQIATPDDYNRLPPGAQYIDPVGHLRTKAGGAGGNASGGFPGQ